jgi:hypothetical protein
VPPQRALEGTAEGGGDGFWMDGVGLVKLGKEGADPVADGELCDLEPDGEDGAAGVRAGNDLWLYGEWTVTLSGVSRPDSSLAFDFLYLPVGSSSP